jgi:CBS domain-containing protein
MPALAQNPQVAVNPPAHTAATTGSPSPQLLQQLRRELAEHAPFAQMKPEHVDAFLGAANLAYYAPEETVLSPEKGAVQFLYCIRQGSVTGRRGLADAAGGFAYEAGDLFPVGAAIGRRAVTSTYVAASDTFCWLLPLERMEALAAQSAPFADFLQRRVIQLLDISRHAVQASYAAQSLAEQSLEATLGSLVRRQPLAVTPDTDLRTALGKMHALGVGSVLVTQPDGVPAGILTRHDVLGRVTLPQVALDSPIAQVMSAPIHTLTVQDTAQDAILLMSRHGIRHVPITDGGRTVSIVSERDLFALQKLTLGHVSAAIRQAEDLGALIAAAEQIRRLARNLLGQGVHARQLTELISLLNDRLAERLVSQVAVARGLDLDQACWLAFGSEGRGEQTISTDQDNGLVFVSENPADERQRWLDFAREVNEGLDACGYPLCKGQIMACNPACCLTLPEWLERFDQWIERGAPQDLLSASIYFDLRAVAGREALATTLRTHITEAAQRVPRFIKQLATNALTYRPPLNWRGGIDTHEVNGREVIDLKLQGTAIFVDVARIYALAHGVAATGTRARLQAVGQAIGLEPQESQAWVTGFEFLQSLRLRVQIAPQDSGQAADGEANPNLIEVDLLNDIDRRVLRESLRVARTLQQRLELDYQR